MDIKKIAKSIGFYAIPSTVIFGVLLYIIRAETNPLRTDISNVQHDLVVLKDEITGLKTEISTNNKNTNDRIDKALTDAMNSLVGKGRKIKGTDTLQKGAVILAIAKSINAKIEPATIVAYGKKVSELSQSPPLSSVAWNNLNLVLSYRSILNAEQQPKFSQLIPLMDIDSKTKYQPTLHFQAYPREPGHTFGPPPVFVAEQTASRDESARLEDLEKPQSEILGYKFVVIMGNGNNDGLPLDHWNLKNVVVINALITYGGGPVRLENVYFVNCTFKFEPTPHSRELGDVLLASAAATFLAGG